MSRLSAIFTGTIGLLALAIVAQADDYPPPIVPEAAKAPYIAAILKDRQFQGTTLHPTPAQERTLERLGIRDGSDFCQEFLWRFPEQKGITFVEPVARSDRYDDPIFKPWQDRCPALALNAWHDQLFDTLNATPKTLRVLPKASTMRDSSYGTRNFELYVVDLDNNPGNGAETIFFSENMYSYWNAVVEKGMPLRPPPTDRNWNAVLPPRDVSEELGRGLAMYTLVNLKQCRTSFVELVWDPYIEDDGPPRRENYTGIVRFDGQNFIYSLWNEARYPELDYSFQLYAMRWNQGKPASIKVCLMGEMHLPPN